MLILRYRMREYDDKYNTVENDTDDYVLPRKLVKGDEIILRNINKRGILLDTPDKNGNVTVQAGVVKTKTNVNNLKLLDDARITVSDEEKKQQAINSYRAKVSRDFHPELDVRGMTGEDAWFMADKYLDEANIAGIKSATIIHGKGTGALRTHLWNAFKKDPRIKSFRAGQFGEGDYGVTIIELK